MQMNVPHNRYRAISADFLQRSPLANHLSADMLHALKIVSKVFPFRANTHVISNLIDWDAAPDDPVFKLVFPAREMLSTEDFAWIERLVAADAPVAEIAAAALSIRNRLNPHPSGQREHNVPELAGVPMQGFQHKYNETVLYFPARGQTCHAYCTFCFRWAQFVGDTELKFASKEAEALQQYLRAHREVTDVLVTGGDPMIMAAHHLAGNLEPLLAGEFEHVQNFRIGTKCLTFWPQRFVSDPDSDDLLRLFERITLSGRNLAIMVHVNHWRELDDPIAQAAIRRLRNSGATLRSQAPLLAGINDEGDIWARNWRDQVRMGIHPYYMFVERDTGPSHHFEVPLHRGLSIYRDAIQQVSGLARSARGPVMSASPGKVEVLDVETRPDRTRFLLQFLQARDPSRVRRPFWAEGKHDACWFDQLELPGNLE